jgi:putative addiction module component (TIGR02574 family)
MDLTTALSVINSLSIDERIRVVEAVWDGIAAEQPMPTITDAQKAELDRRLALHRAAPNDVIPWEVVKQQALERARKQ